MGNDIKLPITHRRTAEEPSTMSQIETTQQLVAEIESINRTMTTTDQQLAQIGTNLEEIGRTIEYYKGIITDRSVKLHQIELEQVNISLVHDNHVEQSKWYLHELSEADAALVTDDSDEYSEADIASMENQASLLNTEVASNEELINDKNGVTDLINH